MSQHQKPGGNWWYKFHHAGQLETAYGFPTRGDAAAAEHAARAAIKAGKLDELRALTKPRTVLTVSQVLAQWVTAGYAEANGRARAAGPAARHAELLKYALEWFADKPVSQVNQPMLVKYAHWRRGQVRQGFAGDRITDREMNTLAQCFHWATGAGLADKNPFIERPRFQTSAEVKHASAYMPASDDELHRLTGWLIATGEPANLIAAAQLLFMALTGLRSGEPGFLHWNARYTDAGPECGHRFERTLEGKTSELLAIAAGSRGARRRGNRPAPA